jgi:cytochrome oxidase Cu insertion factor (SCO1/SenC/PrrC family)
MSALLAAVFALSGTLLSLAGTTAIVHHDPFGGMPAMTMSFRVPSPPHASPGDHLDATVDTSTDPWTLRDVRVTHHTVPSAIAPNFVHVGDRVPDVAFVDQRGRAFRLRDLHVAYALAFIYTRCADPSMCPLVSATFERAARLTRGTRTALVEVSLDPAYDRPPVLARYSAQFGADPARWHLLTGDPRAVLDFSARFGILERSAGPVTIVHTERLAIVRSDGTIDALLDGARWHAADVVERLRRASATGQTPGERPA